MAIELAEKHSCVAKGGSLDEIHFRVIASSSRENGAALPRGTKAFILANELCWAARFPD
jgi:hypothetical protein